MTSRFGLEWNVVSITDSAISSATWYCPKEALLDMRRSVRI